MIPTIGKRKKQTDPTRKTAKKLKFPRRNHSRRRSDRRLRFTSATCLPLILSHSARRKSASRFQFHRRIQIQSRKVTSRVEACGDRCSNSRKSHWRTPFPSARHRCHITAKLRAIPSSDCNFCRRSRSRKKLRARTDEARTTSGESRESGAFRHRNSQRH